MTSAGESVNADDMVSVINRHAEGVRAQIVGLEDGPKVGATFVDSVRYAFKQRMAPLVLFYIDGPTDNIGREYDFQHWVNIFAVEDKGKWLYTAIKNLGSKIPLRLITPPKTDEILIWTWGKPYVIDGPELGKASVLSINWLEPPRMWQKLKQGDVNWKDGDLNWDEVSPKNDKYTPPDPSSLPPKSVRYTKVAPSKGLDKRGFVVVEGAG